MYAVMEVSRLIPLQLQVSVEERGGLHDAGGK